MYRVTKDDKDDWARFDVVLDTIDEVCRFLFQNVIDDIDEDDTWLYYLDGMIEEDESESFLEEVKTTKAKIKRIVDSYAKRDVDEMVDAINDYWAGGNGEWLEISKIYGPPPKPKVESEEKVQSWVDRLQKNLEGKSAS